MKLSKKLRPAVARQEKVINAWDPILSGKIDKNEINGRFKISQVLNFISDCERIKLKGREKARFVSLKATHRIGLGLLNVHFSVYLSLAPRCDPLVFNECCLMHAPIDTNTLACALTHAPRHPLPLTRTRSPTPLVFCKTKLSLKFCKLFKKTLYFLNPGVN